MAEQILAVLAKVARKKPHEIESHLSLASIGLSSSFGLSAVRSLIEAQGFPKLPPLTMRMTVAEVVALAAGGSAVLDVAPIIVTAPAPRLEHRTGSLAGLGLGMDMQDIGSMPLAADYRADPFYTAHFHPSEISTAVLRADLRSHLCGIFCAKEAAKKSHPALLELRMTDLLVTHDGMGRPTLQVLAEGVDIDAFEFLLSITHSDCYAAATCISVAR